MTSPGVVFDPQVERILHQMEGDPQDWTRPDLVKVLEGMQITRKIPLSATGSPDTLASSVGACERWTHVKHYDLWVLVTPHFRVSRERILHVLRIAGSLRSRHSPAQGG